ncbi:MAG TPA: DUF1684 domain-containing protein [Polyangiales bacterium]|nr:DUF1684 domain-containing protein [Polyangiales bacterium]
MLDPDHEREVLHWRERRVARLTARDGWLSLINKVFLEPGVPLAVGAAAEGGVQLPAGKAPAQLGSLLLADGRVRFTPEPGAAIELQRWGQSERSPLTAAVELVTDARNAPDRLLHGDLVLDVMERGDAFAMRVRDVSRARPELAGIEYYPISSAWRLAARFEPYLPEQTIELVFEGGIAEPYAAPGAVVFEKDGVSYRLDPVFERERKRLWLVFADPTNRDTTYGAGRFLYAPLPQGDRVVLDFNQAFNPPCAFSPFVACPLPPFQNRLELRVEAGEKRPIEH